MNELLERIKKIGIVPVVVIEDVKYAVPLAKSLCAGGIPCAEITFRTSAAEEAIRSIANACKDMIVGAGTVLTKEQAECAINAGASFIVSPGLNADVVNYCLDRNITVVPGCATPSEVEEAIRLGVDTVKFFPAQAAGGIDMIRAMSAPYSKIHFMPTGGINEDNLKTYLNFNPVIACGGTWMIDKKMLKEGDYKGIQRLTEKAVSGMLNLQLLMSACDGEVMIQTNYMERAMYHLEMRGYRFSTEEAEKDEKGNILKIKFKGNKNDNSMYLLRTQ